MFHRLLILACFMLLLTTLPGCTKSSPTSVDEVPATPAASPAASPMPKSVRIVRDSLPDGAPKWLNIRIATLNLSQTPILEATGVVFGIPNRQLAINAASSRALHEVSTWLESSNIKGLKVIDTAFSAEQHWAAARVQVPLPEGWTPPSPLPESRLP